MEARHWRWGPELLPMEFEDPNSSEPDTGLYMDPDFMDKLYGLRKLIGSIIKITKNGGYSSDGHSSGSAHYMGLAADIKFPKERIDFVSNRIRECKFNGVGYYPNWNMPGFHVDMASRVARWVRNKEGLYISLT